MEHYYEGQLAIKPEPEGTGVQMRKRKLGNSSMGSDEPRSKWGYQFQADCGYSKNKNENEEAVSDVWKTTLAYNLDIHHRQTAESRGQEHLDYCANSEIWKLYQDLMPGKSEKSESASADGFKTEDPGQTKEATDHLANLMSEMEISDSSSQPQRRAAEDDLWNTWREDDGRRAARSLEKIIESMGPTPVQKLTSDSHLGNQELASLSLPQAIKREPLTTVKQEVFGNEDQPSQSLKMEGFPVKIKQEPMDSNEAEIRTADENVQPANPTPIPATVPEPSPYPPKWYVKVENCFGEIVGKWV